MYFPLFIQIYVGKYQAVKDFFCHKKKKIVMSVWLAIASSTLACVKYLGTFKNSGEEPSMHTFHLKKSYFLLCRAKILNWEAMLAEHMDLESFWSDWSSWDSSCYANKAKLFSQCSLLQFNYCFIQSW